MVFLLGMYTLRVLPVSYSLSGGASTRRLTPPTFILTSVMGPTKALHSMVPSTELLGSGGSRTVKYSGRRTHATLLPSVTSSSQVVTPSNNMSPTRTPVRSPQLSTVPARRVPSP